MKKLLTLTLALALLLTGCGMQAAPAETPEATASTVVRTEVVYPLPAPAELVGVARVGDALVVAGDDGGAPVLGVADWSLDGAPSLGETRLLDAGEAAICGVAAGEDCFYVLTGEEPASRLNASREIVRNEDYQGRYCVLKYAADGALLGQMTLRDWRAGEMLGIAAGPDGELLLYACQTAALLRWCDGEAEDAQYLDAALAALGAEAQLAENEDGLAANYDAFRRRAAQELGEDTCAALDALLHSTTAALRYADAPLCTAIASAAASFLSGDKTAEEAAALIQSRASVYMAEKYGK